MTTVGDAEPGDVLAKWGDDDRATVVSIHQIEQDTIPQDRTFRDAWTFDGQAFTHDMPRARDVLRARMRAVRAPKLQALDLAFQRATEAKDAKEQKRIAQIKQALRDVTAHPGIEAAETPDQLKEVWPDELA